MAEKKWQHYVPRFYLRLFAIAKSDRCIRLYNIEQNRYVEQASIADQAAENYFYKSKDIEDVLSDFEGRIATVIYTIIRKKALAKNGSDGYCDLLLFLLLQHARTRYAVDEHDEMWKKVKTVVLGDKPESMLPPQLREERENVPRFLMEVTVRNAWKARDLRAKLIVNDTPNPFITSDHPVVLYNQLLKSKNVVSGRTGIGCKGLQLFFPLNGQLLLHLFDSETYVVGGRRLSKRLVQALRVRDVWQLNHLQAINANKNLYFNDTVPESYIHKLMKSARRFRRVDKVIVEEYPSAEPALLPQPSLLAQRRSEIETSLCLSFVRITDAGQEYDPRRKSVHMRNEKVLRAMEEPMIRHLQERLVGNQLAGIYAKKSGA
jgi:hypothetical protein